MKIKVAISQFACIKGDQEANINKAFDLALKAVSQKVNILLLQELFQSEYFCSTQNAKFFDYAISFPDNSIFEKFSNFCKQNNIVIPISFFEKSGQNYFNSVVVIDADGSFSSLYRKSHLPDGPGYNEKFYFSPGNTGFKVFKTKFASIGCAICWDQWFPECARSMTMDGAEILMYPTAIGSEPHDSTISSKDHWQNVMKGHAAANQIPVLASNRVGVEKEGSISLTFYGNSFIANHLGNVISNMDNSSEGIEVSELDLEESKKYRQSWGNFRDRRPELYKKVCDF
jgi:N-carbamoylputrescine amidase